MFSFECICNYYILKNSNHAIIAASNVITIHLTIFYYVTAALKKVKCTPPFLPPKIKNRAPGRPQSRLRARKSPYFTCICPIFARKAKKNVFCRGRQKTLPGKRQKRKTAFTVFLFWWILPSANRTTFRIIAGHSIIISGRRAGLLLSWQIHTRRRMRRLSHTASA